MRTSITIGIGLVAVGIIALLGVRLFQNRQRQAASTSPNTQPIGQVATPAALASPASSPGATPAGVSTPAAKPKEEKTDTAQAERKKQYQSGGKNAYLGTPCTANTSPSFRDLTDSAKINKVTPPFINGETIQDRAFLWIANPGDKVPIYAPADAELVEGVYKNIKDNTDYDLWFQVSCEWWFFINHVSEPIDQIKQRLPQEPATSSRDRPKISPPLKFKAGDLLGYTIGTNQAHNFDFAVFDLNHTNTLPASYGGDKRTYNFVCSVTASAELSANYKAKIESAAGSVC